MWVGLSFTNAFVTDYKCSGIAMRFKALRLFATKSLQCLYELVSPLQMLKELSILFIESAIKLLVIFGTTIYDLIEFRIHFFQDE